MLPVASTRADVRQLAHAHYFSSALHAAVTLGLPEVLAAGPRSSREVAAALDTHEDATARLLAFLASFGILHRDEAGAFALTEVGAHLRRDHPASLAREVAMFAGGETFTAWGGLVDSVRTGRPAFELQRGKPLFAWLAERPDSASRFHLAWEEITRTCAAQAIEAYDFGGISVVTDVGGGYGIFLAILLTARPELRAVLFDLPSSTDGAPANLAAAGVSDRVEIVNGDALEGLPPMEFALVKSVVHGMDDEQTVRLLAHTARALPPGGRVVVIERVIPDTPDYHWSRLVDMTMMVMTGGRERTRADYERLYAASGLILTRIVDLECGFSLIEGERPAAG